MERLRPRRRHIGQAAWPKRPLDVARRPGGMARVLEDVTADREIERLVAQSGLQRPRIAANIGDAVDVGALEEIEADETRSCAEAVGDEFAPVADVSVGNEGARSHLQDPRRALADRLGQPVEQQVDFTRNARAYDA